MTPERPAMQRSPAFATTRWSVVIEAGREESVNASDALERLCESYWYPLYAYVRRRGVGAEDARDLTQDFFARILARKTLAHADPARGRFRSFILTALKHFLADHWERSHALKRGGGVKPLSFDFELAEERFEREPVDNHTPDRAFDRQWALSVLSSVLNRLEAEFKTAGREKQFEVLKPALLGSRDSQPYLELAAKLGVTEGSVKVSVHRMRKRYRELLETEIADTVATASDARQELQHLMAALAEA